LDECKEQSDKPKAVLLHLPHAGKLCCSARVLQLGVKQRLKTLSP
jgi:hypothetical protein